MRPRASASWRGWLLSTLLWAACSPATAEEWVLLVHDYPGHAGVSRELLHADGKFWAREEDLREWRVTPSASSRVEQGTSWYALSEIPGVQQNFDEATQALSLDFAGSERKAQIVSMQPRTSAAPGPVSVGGFLNTDFLFSSAAGAFASAAQIEAGAFGPLGRVGNTLLFRDGQPLRLDTFALRENPEAMTTLRLGDSISRPGSWGRAARYAGLQWGTDFSLQPYFATFPQPVLRGDAVLPSSLEVFVDGQRRGSQSTDAGPFELRDIPALSGAGEALVVVRDNLGRETRVAQPFYVSPSLLKPGLRDYSAEAGFLRRDYGIESLRYGDFFVAGVLRQGFTDRFTAELRSEFQTDRAAFGGSGVWLLGQAGLLSATTVFSQGEQGGGGLAALGFEREAPGLYSFALRTQWTTPAFSQIGLDRAPARRQDLARLSVQPHAGGNVSLLWTHEDARDSADIELRALGYGLQVGDGGFLNLGVAQTCAPDCETSARLDFTWSFGGNLTAAVQHEHSRADDRSRITLQQDSGQSLGWQWRAAVERGHRQAQLRSELSGQWRGARGNLSADLLENDGLSYRVGASTGIAVLGGEAFWTRPVTGSFGVVNVPGLSDVQVSADGRPVGRTDEAGRLLVTDLRAYERNRLALAVEDIPIEVDLPALALDVVPRGRSGVSLDFSLPAP